MQRGIYYKPFIIAGIVILILYVAIGLTAHLTGTLDATTNAKITELSVCVQEHAYHPEAAILQGTPTVYACGKVEGTTSMTVALDLFNDSQGSADLIRATRLWPGVFYVPLSSSNDLTPGKYHI